MYEFDAQALMGLPVMASSWRFLRNTMTTMTMMTSSAAPPPAPAAIAIVDELDDVPDVLVLEAPVRAVVEAVDESGSV